MILMSSAYGPDDGRVACQRPCRRHFTLDAQRFGLHIWAGIGLDRLSRPEGIDLGSAPEGHGYEHRGIHRQRSEVERRGSVHEGYAAISAVRFLRPSRPDP